MRVPAEAAEEARAAVIELAASGFEEVELGAEVELAVYTDAAGERELSVRFPNLTSAEVPPGWEEGWRKHHRAVQVAGLWIGPPWEAAPPGAPAVVIDPGRAFGTGAHATTRMCVELLAQVERGSLVDIGCGSGVLAIAAVRLGFAPVIAVDNDPIAVEVARTSAAANRVGIEVELVDVLAGPPPERDVAVANVLLSPVIEVLARLEARHAVTSGYLSGDMPDASRWNHEQRLTADGWAADLWSRSPEQGTRKHRAGGTFVRTPD